MLNFHRYPMKKVLHLILLPALLMTYSCQPDLDSGKVEDIDQLILEAQSTLTQLHSIDTSQVQTGLKELMLNVQYIQKYHADTMSYETAQYLSRYYTLANLLKDYDSYEVVEKNLQLSKKQLEDLKHDYVNHAIEEDKFSQYFTEERNQLVQLQEKVQGMENNWRRFEEKAMEYNPKVDSIVNHIETKRNSLRL